MSLLQLLNSALVVVVILSAGNCFGQHEPPGPFPRGATVVTPKQRLPTDADKVIRDFVHLLHPDWDGAWDILIAGKRSMNPNFGVDGWSFAIVKATQPVVQGFYPSAIACYDGDTCLTTFDVSNAYLLGRLYQHGTRIQAYQGSRPKVAQENADLQQALHADSSLQHVQDGIVAAKAHFPPSSEAEIRRHLEAEPLFVKYGFHISSLQFCRSVGPPDQKQIAMFWSAHVFSARLQQRYLVTIEPFEADITGLLAVSKGDEAEVSCTP